MERQINIEQGWTRTLSNAVEKGRGKLVASERLMIFYCCVNKLFKTSANRNESEKLSGHTCFCARFTFSYPRSCVLWLDDVNFECLGSVALARQRNSSRLLKPLHTALGVSSGKKKFCVRTWRCSFFFLISVSPFLYALPRLLDAGETRILSLAFRLCYNVLSYPFLMLVETSHEHENEFDKNSRCFLSS